MQTHVSGSTEYGCVCVPVYSAVMRVVQYSASQRLPVLAVAVLLSWTWKSSRLTGAGALSAYRTVHSHVVPMRPARSSACVVCLPTAAWPAPWPGAARRVTGFPYPLQYSTSCTCTHAVWYACTLKCIFLNTPCRRTHHKRLLDFSK